MCEEAKNKFPYLSGNALKILAAIFMTLDHIGVFIFPRIVFFRAIGRLAFPIFAYMIAEGAHYTKNKFKYFIRIFLVGLLCQSVLFAIDYKEWYFNILITFSFSVILIYSLELVKSAFVNKNIGYAIFSSVVFACLLLLAFVLSEAVTFDYGIYGILAPLFPSVLRGIRNNGGIIGKLDNKYVHIALLAVPLLLLSLDGWRVQFFAFFSLPLLFLYSEKRGKLRMKYFFYIFYPLHIGIIAIISFILNK